MTELDEVLQDLAKIQSLPELNQYVFDLRETYGVANVAFHLQNAPHANKTNPLLLVTYEQQWVQRYVDYDYFCIDPIVLLGSHCFLPLDWDSVDRSSSRIRKLFAEAESYGVGNRGLTLPIRGPTGEKSLLTVTTYQSENEWMRRRLPLLRDLHVIAHFIHDRSLTLSNLRKNVSRPQLSPRERQCLERIARGRAPKQIAHELGLSVSAVRLYISSAKLKLGAANTYQAVAQAVRDEYVSA